MIRKSLLQLIFSGSFMKRWNDKLRPVELWEVDKQAHKMITAWALYQENCAGGFGSQDELELGREVIEGGIFEYLYRLVITDIKPPVFYRIKANPEHYRQLTQWVLQQLQPRVQSLGPEFWARLQEYFTIPEPTGLARDILGAAHLYASQWEFHLIRGINPWDEELAEIETAFDRGLADYGHVQGVPQMLDQKRNSLGLFLRQCGQLRFQKRWSQTPRIPETSVLGHMFIVACYAYFFSLVNGSCPRMAQNNFFAGLFHDLPELLTRDIISPVKRSVAEIGDLIREYEEHEVQQRVLSLLQRGGYGHVAGRLHYFLGLAFGSEFVPTVNAGGEARNVSREELMDTCNRDDQDPKDGELLKVCDSLAAFIEAYTAMRNGITTDQLSQAVWRIRKDYNQFDLGNGLHIGSLLADFD
ncbi:HD domain-containing protein [Desulfovermiculus halophilus]|jgi:putative hydrolase of HD superfamily|uniref:HD domain-containing protein n=1 Tax=Desulfovermiculus halophilus TaxID=339722 RepID=UPI000481D8C6|nr:HD domain-containing protein [Desulfovermiculus halophilus]